MAWPIILTGRHILSVQWSLHLAWAPEKIRWIGRSASQVNDWVGMLLYPKCLAIYRTKELSSDSVSDGKSAVCLSATARYRGWSDRKFSARTPLPCANTLNSFSCLLYWGIVTVCLCSTKARKQQTTCRTCLHVFHFYYGVFLWNDIHRELRKPLLGERNGSLNPLLRSNQIFRIRVYVCIVFLHLAIYLYSHLFLYISLVFY